MSIIGYKIRIYGYKMLGILWYSILPIVMYNLYPLSRNIKETIIISIASPIIFTLITLMLLVCIELKSIYLTYLFKMPKLIFHEKLGYFSAYTYSDKGVPRLEIFKQKTLSLSSVGNIQILNIRQVNSEVKSILDRKYSERLADIEKMIKIKSGKDIVREWDGILK